MISIKHPQKALSDSELSSLTQKTKKEYLYSFDKITQESNLTFINFNGYFFFCDKKDLVQVKYTGKHKRLCPKYYMNNTSSSLGFININGEYYSLSHEDLVKTADTKNYGLAENFYRGYGGTYYEKEKDLVYNKIDELYFPEKDGVITEDTETLEYKYNCYQGRSGYYKYSVFSRPQTRWEHAPYINSTKFPKNIDERRIGVEYEFGNTYDMFKPFIKSKYIKYWQSVRDGSLDPIPQGIEFVSVPFKLSEIEKTIEFLDFCEDNGCEIFKQCGFHVHIGASDYNFMDLSALVSLCTKIESNMFKLGGTHRQKNEYCKSLDSKFKGFQEVVLPKDKNKAGKQLYSNQNAVFEERHTQSKYVDARGHTGARYYWLNVDRFFYKREEPEQKTVEFRNHIATYNKKDWLNFTLLCYYIVEYAKNHSKQTCLGSTIYDIIKTSHITHRKQLTKYINSKLK